MTKLDTGIIIFKKIWSPALLACLIAAVVLDIACQFLNFTDPPPDGSQIWNDGWCKDNSTSEIDDCMLMKSSGILAIVFGISMTICVGLYMYKKNTKPESLGYGITTLISGVGFLVFQTVFTIWVKDQIANRPSNSKDVVAWELLLTATVIAYIAIVLNPITIKYLGYIGKNLNEIYLEANKKGAKSAAIQPLGKFTTITPKQANAMNPFAGMKL